MSPKPETMKDAFEEDLASSSSDSEAAEESDVDSEEDELQNQVADVPFEVIQSAKAQGHSKVSRDKSEQQLKRLNKNRPMEISSKKPVGRFRDVMQAPKRVVRDPRFESLCGKFEDAQFKKSYSFFYDEKLPAERQELYRSLKKEKTPQAIGEMKARLAQIDRKLKSEQERRKQAQKDSELKKKERELVKQGKKPFYLKESDKRKAALIEKYQELKSAGKLDAFLAKRRRKNAAKDHRYMPYRREL